MTQEEADRIVAEVQDTPGITLAYITKNRYGLVVMLQSRSVSGSAGCITLPIRSVAQWITLKGRTQVPGDLYYAAHS